MEKSVVKGDKTLEWRSKVVGEQSDSQRVYVVVGGL